jgi:isopropylmalate/homocitrate/citramalate synthase
MSLLSYRIFLSTIKSNNNWLKIYQGLNCPRPFDVSLRDGLQTANPEYYPLLKKRDIYHEIVFNDYPRAIEIGSVVSEKVFPIFKDSVQLCDEAIEYQTGNKENKSDIYLLVPNKEKLSRLLEISKCANFSLISSVSNIFQRRNINKTLDETKENINEMLEIIKNKKVLDSKVKLYVSCINECPLSGKVDKDFIVKELLYYNALSVDEICLSDTCGTLEVNEFEYIVDTCKYFGIPMSKFSLHLHVKQNRQKAIERLMYSALDRKIINFDVSMINGGGCSVTMKADEMSPNLSYSLYYNTLFEYIKDKCIMNESKNKI